MTRLALIADDLTGALDASVPFALHGYRTSISFRDNDELAGADIQVYSTESRNSSDEQATAGIRQLLGTLPIQTAPVVFKKIDSTLRGPIGAELKSLIDVLKPERVLICPAFPEQGRRVVEGRVWIDDQPLVETVFGRDIVSDWLLDLTEAIGFRSCTRLLPLETLRSRQDDARASLAAAGIVIADAETSDDLRLLARYGLDGGIRLLVGSAGLAAGLASELPERHRTDSDRSQELSLRKGEQTLIVAGSLHPRTSLQIETLQDARLPVIILTAPPPSRDPERQLLAKAVAAELADQAYRTVQEQQLAGLIVTGGDIARAVCARLGVSHLTLVDQVEPGMPVSRIGGGIASGLKMITKAGGFGDALALERAVGYLTR